MKKDSSIYVAGHRGMVGSAIVNQLEDQDYFVSNSKLNQIFDLRLQNETDLVFKLLSPDYVFLAAAKVGGIHANLTYPAEFIYDNIMISTNVIHASYKNNVKRLINLGSSCIYPKFAKQPMSEDQLLSGYLEQTNEPYAIAKISAIKMVQYYNKQYGCDYISLMPTNLYGRNDNYNLETSHVIPALLRKFILAKALRDSNEMFIRADIFQHPIGYNFKPSFEFNNIIEQLKDIGITKDYVKIWGTGEVYREFMHTDDLANACLYFMNLKDTSKINNFLNVGTGVDMKISEIVDIIKNLVGFDGRVQYDISKPSGTPKKLLDVTKANELGWSAKIDIETGLQMIYDDYLKSKI